MITQEYLKSVLHYNQDTGVFTWLIKPKRTMNIGDIAGGYTDRGYIKIKLLGRLWRAHHLAWLYMTGELPPSQLDHINGVKDDNRISNLRIANNTEQQGNQKLMKTNKTGLKGVCKSKAPGKWYARISVNWKNVHLGTFNCPAAASFAYQIAADNHFGKFARIF